jgi:hypothetical protein
MQAKTDGAREVTSSILKVSRDEASERLELEFELDFFARLSIAERFDLMFRKSREMAEQLRAHGHGGPAPMLKRA